MPRDAAGTLPWFWAAMREARVPPLPAPMVNKSKSYCSGAPLPAPLPLLAARTCQYKYHSTIVYMHMPGMCPGHAPWLGICHREFELSALCQAYLQAPLLDAAVWSAASCQHAAAVKRRSACSVQHGGILATQATMCTCTQKAACSSS